MTHYDIDYSGLTPQQAYSKSLDDTREYVGDHRYEHIINEFRKYPPMTVDALAMYLSMAGIQGFPIYAIHDQIWPYG